MDELLAAAEEALASSYAPYSDYGVGAALATADGTVYTGCNIENANYSNSVHAEELAISKAIEAGEREFQAIAVVSSERDGVTPCGMCRQTLAEFCADSFTVYCLEADDTVSEYTLGELLPNTITAAHLDK